MNIKISYTYTPQQITHAMHFNSFPNKGSKQIYVFVTVAIISVSALIWYKPTIIPDNTPIVILKYVLFSALALWLFLIPIVLYVYFVGSKKAYYKQSQLRASFDVEFTEQAISYERKSNNIVEVTPENKVVPWTAIVRKAENQEFIFLYESIRKVYIIPKNAFANNNDFATLHHFLSTKSNIKTRTLNWHKLWTEPK